MVTIWNHNPERAKALADKLAEDGLEVRATGDLAASAAEADIISCATLSQQPLIRGDWLKPGAHLDLVGGFTPDMRETDDAAVRRARIYVDTRVGATNEAGDLFDLTREQVEGRQDSTDITLFKSVGTALEDLAAAELVFRKNP